MSARDGEEFYSDLAEFFQSSATTVEWLSDALRTKINIATGLEEVVRAATAQGHNIVIAGTAGSGKTHLLRTIGAPPKYRVITDLAALPEDEWKKIFTSSRPVVIAGNEGAFLQGQHKSLPGFRLVVELLHAIQKGEDPRGEGPVVIDAAGFDPAGSHVIAEIVRLPILQRYAQRFAADTAAYWEMLMDEKVGQRLAFLVETAAAESGADGFTFRQLWQFVADLLEIGGQRNEPWFARVFSGNSEIARRIRLTFVPTSLSLPHIGNQLWHGDVIRLKPYFLDCAIPALERLSLGVLSEQPVETRIALFDRLRLLAAFGLKESPLDQMLYRGVDLWSKVRYRQALPLVQAINRYFAFNLIELGDDLELWLQHDTERRLIKPDVQISLGTARAEDFVIRRSSVIANRPDGIEQIEGGRLLLVHSPSKATLVVSKDLVDGILRTRAHRTNERRDVEYDWRIGRFFEHVSVAAARSDRLKAARFNFQTRTGRLMAWQISPDQIRKVA